MNVCGCFAPNPRLGKNNSFQDDAEPPELAFTDKQNRFSQDVLTGLRGLSAPTTVVSYASCRALQLCCCLAMRAHQTDCCNTSKTNVPGMSESQPVTTVVQREYNWHCQYSTMISAYVLQGRSHATVYFPHSVKAGQPQRAPSQNFRRVTSGAPSLDAPQMNGELPCVAGL